MADDNWMMGYLEANPWKIHVTVIRELRVESQAMLEDAIELLLQQSGFQTQRSVDFDGPEGKVHLDIVAIRERDGMKDLRLIQCGHWNQHVPLDVVSAFHSFILSIEGAEGHLLSEQGFSFNGLDEAELLPLHLTNWENFQDVYLWDYYRAWVLPRMQSFAGRLSPYFNPTGSPSPELEAMRRRHQPVLNIIRLFAEGSFKDKYGSDLLPLASWAPPETIEGAPEDLVQRRDYWVFLERLSNRVDAIVQEFEHVAGH